MLLNTFIQNKRRDYSIITEIIYSIEIIFSYYAFYSQIMYIYDNFSTFFNVIKSSCIGEVYSRNYLDTVHIIVLLISTPLFIKAYESCKFYISSHAKIHVFIDKHQSLHQNIIKAICYTNVILMFILNNYIFLMSI